MERGVLRLLVQLTITIMIMTCTIFYCVQNVRYANSAFFVDLKNISLFKSFQKLHEMYVFNRACAVAFHHACLNVKKITSNKGKKCENSNFSRVDGCTSSTAVKR